ncbi:hypothetical protein [Streptomyces sp. NPDC046727]|uniref:hypothetical protein n=1 Tax=Streptomyces sp. NPDC046727 TaxID=3155373 RepID=UPI0033D9C39A
MLDPADFGPGIQQTLLTSAPFWALEHELAVRYFATGHRTPENDKRWIGHQMFKEWTGSGVYGPRGTTVATMIQEVAQEIAGLDSGSIAPNPLRSTYVKLSFASDELRHYAQLHDLYLLAETASPPPSIADLGYLGDGKALTELRWKWREDRLGEIAVDLSEGGGLGLYFGIRSATPHLDRSKAVDAEILEVAERTIEDETRHLLGRFRSAQKHELTEADWTRISALLREISHQKLLERNEQFNFVLSDDEVSQAVKQPDLELAQTFLTTHLGFLLEELGLTAHVS